MARLDPAALARFEADWTAATARARDEYSLLPARYFVEHWFNWVAVARWPELAARLRACERIVAESPDRAERREAAAEISHWPEYDYVVLNSDLDSAQSKIRSILEAERARRTRLIGVGDFVTGLTK